MPISLPSDGDADWGPEVRAAITAVNDLETSPRVKVSEAPLSLLDPRVAAVLDGTGDQAAKIATAISLLPAAGGAIYQPPGVLRTGAITLTKPVRWFGAGDQASTIKAAASFTGTLFTIADTAPFSRVSDVQFDGGTTATYLLKVASARTRLDHLHLTGQAGASGAALWFNGVSSSSSAHAAQCSDIRVIGCTGYAALLQGFAYDNEFTNFWAGTCNVGIRIENTNAFFTNTHIWGCTGNGVELRDGSHLFTNTYVETCGGSGFNLFNAHRVKISNSNLWKNQGHGVSLATSDRCSIIGCNIYDNGGNGVNATDSVYGQVIGNTLYEDTSSVQTQDRPVVTSGTSDKWVVTGNVMLTSEHAAGGVSMAGSNNIIDNNIATIPLDTNATDAQLRDRATHTGTQAATTIADFAEAVDDRVASLLTSGSNVSIVYNDTTGTITIAASGGGGGGGGGESSPVALYRLVQDGANYLAPRPATGYVDWLGVSDPGELLLAGDTWTQLPPTAPNSPTIGTATGGDTQAAVAFTAPAWNGGAAITGYTATSTPGGLTGTGGSSPITVTGLTNGTSYTFKVKATNSVGVGAESAASNAVTPGSAASSVTDNFTGTNGAAWSTSFWKAAAGNVGIATLDIQSNQGRALLAGTGVYESVGRKFNVANSANWRVRGHLAQIPSVTGWFFRIGFQATAWDDSLSAATAGYYMQMQGAGTAIVKRDDFSTLLNFTGPTGARWFDVKVVGGAISYKLWTGVLADAPASYTSVSNPTPVSGTGAAGITMGCSDTAGSYDFRIDDFLYDTNPSA